MVPMTANGFASLQAELQHLKSVERPTVITQIAEARAQGDLSENAEYDAAREKQGFIEGRIQDLEGKLSNAQILNPKEIGGDGKVVFGATVTLADDDGKETTYTIVGEDEADLSKQKISYTSPMARAIMTKFEGDEVKVQTPSGVKNLEIMAVAYN